MQESCLIGAAKLQSNLASQVILKESPALPEDILKNIFCLFDDSSILHKCMEVNKSWEKAALVVWKSVIYKNNLFSPDDWLHHLGRNLGASESKLAFDSLTDDIVKAYRKDLGRGRVTFWLPAETSIIDFALLLNKKWSDEYCPNDAYSIKKSCTIAQSIIHLYGNIIIKNSGWVEMAICPLKGTDDIEDLTEKQALVTRLNQGSIKQYRFPKILEGMVGIAALIFKGKETPNNTLCQEQNLGYSVALIPDVNGLLVAFRLNHNYMGVTVARDISEPTL